MVKRFLMAGMMVLASIFAPTTPAIAAIGDCGGEYLCWWDSVNFTGTRWQVTLGYILQQPGDCLILGTSLGNNKASSIYLNADLVSINSLTLYDLNGGGPSRGISSTNWSDSNMLSSPGIASFSNVMSSICANT